MTYKQHIFVLRVLEAGEFKLKEPTGLVSGEDLHPDSRMAIFSLCPQVEKGAGGLSGVSFIRTLIPFMRAPFMT